MANDVTERLDQSLARRLMIAAQGLGEGGASAEEVVGRTGFVRTLGGVDVYLAIRARRPETTPGEVESVATAGGLRIVPAARGCIYLVARDQVGMALQLAASLSQRRNEREQAKAGILEGELDRVGDAILAELGEHGPQSTHGLRRRLGETVVRSLGEAGKKVGLSSTLPPALRQLEFDGRIERRVEGHRLDRERYEWFLASDSTSQERLDEPELHGRLARLFLRAAGLATRPAFAAWSGLGQRAATKALVATGAVQVEIEGGGEVSGEAYWALPSWLASAREALESSPPVAFLPFEDNLVAFQQGPAFWVGSKYHAIEVPVWGRGRGSTLGDARHSSLRTLVAEGRIVGFWEFDPDTSSVVYEIFDPVTAATREQLEAEAAVTGAFLAEGLGHGRSFSLDTDDAMRRRVAHIRALAG